jgi:molybdate transport system substrate-binding protein
MAPFPFDGAMMEARVLRVRLAAILTLCALFVVPAHAGEVRVAVASNFSAPMERIAELFRQKSGHTVKLSLGATGKFYAQIRGGAPFDVLLAADDAIPQKLEQEGHAVSRSGFVYALGRLTLWSARRDFVDEKGAVLSRGDFSRLAIADPRLAPYGMAAKETLEKLAMWNALQRKLVMGENITQTFQFVASENAELGFVALSQIMHDGEVAEGSYWLVPESMHKPIRQGAVLLSGAQDVAAAQDFLAFLKSDKAKAVIRGYGYGLP